MHTTSLATLALTVLTLGFITGRVYERASRAWADYQARRAEVPILRTLARLLSAKAAGWVLVAAAVAAWSVWQLAQEGQ